jgi:GNAT superfamily N-acetyltransferase
MDYHSALDSKFVRAADAPIRWAEYITNKLNDPAFSVLVADAGDQLAGYVVATIADYPPISTIKSYGFLQEIAVREECRRAGIGQQLYEAAEVWLRERGVSQIEVKVDVANPVAREFWGAAGFVPHTETLIKRFE